MRQTAERLDVSHSLIGKIEQGERRIDVIEFMVYCEALAISPIQGLIAVKPSLNPE